MKVYVLLEWSKSHEPEARFVGCWGDLQRAKDASDTTAGDAGEQEIYETDANGGVFSVLRRCWNWDREVMEDWGTVRWEG